jgi:protein gp37
MNTTIIEWTDSTLNPVVGCLNGCVYCYARKMAKRKLHKCDQDLCPLFVPHQHLERLERLKPTQKPKRIFIDSMWDWNGKGVKIEWLKKIIAKMFECRQHTFQILSKIPKGYSRFKFSKNVWLGTSITKTKDCHRVDDLKKNNPNNTKFVSIEPLHEQIDYWISGVGWIIIGAETGNRKGKIIPEKKWIDLLIKNARAENIPIFLKDNLGWHEQIREFPNE